MRSGECLYCGQPGHFISVCPVRPKTWGSPVAVGVLVSQPSSSARLNSRLQVPASLCSNSPTIPFLALIYFGAEDNFLDRDLAIQSGFSLGPLESPVNANALDGRLLACVPEQTASLTLVISGNHSKRIHLKIISAPETPVVLGHPWLKLHNPQINWSIGKILGWSPHCHSACLRSALSSVEAPTIPPDHNPATGSNCRGFWVFLPSPWHSYGYCL